MEVFTPLNSLGMLGFLDLVLSTLQLVVPILGTVYNFHH